MMKSPVTKDTAVFADAGNPFRVVSDLPAISGALLVLVRRCANYANYAN
jgi:hypothetical protein